jgi:hypothetical protein
VAWARPLILCQLRVPQRVPIRTTLHRPESAGPARHVIRGRQVVVFNQKVLTPGASSFPLFVFGERAQRHYSFTDDCNFQVHRRIDEAILKIENAILRLPMFDLIPSA